MSIEEKHMIIDSEFVICEICEKKLEKIDNRHLKSHKITFDVYRKQFPNEPTMTKQKLEKELNGIEKRKESISKIKNKLKEVPCYFHPDRTIIVGVYEPKYGLCDECKSLKRILPSQEKAITNMRKTIKERYGVDNVSKLDSVNEKRRIKDSQKTKEEKDAIVRKREQTMVETIGEDWSKINNEKSKQAMLEKYGVEYAFQVPDFIEKSNLTKSKRTDQEKLKSIEKLKETKLKNHGDSNFNNVEKRRKTTFEKRGVLHHFQDPEVIRVRDEKRNIRKNDKVKDYLEKVKFELLDDQYIGCNYKHNFKCLRCGNEFQKSWNNIQQGYVCVNCKPPVDIKCPYCGIQDFYQLYLVHLDKHKKTIEDLKNEFPEVFNLIQEYDKINFGKTYGTEKQINIPFTPGKTKVVRCWYDYTEDCCHDRIEVSVFYPDRYLCNKCKKLNRENPDGRTKEEADEKRRKLFLKKSNGQFINPNQFPETKLKVKNTNEKIYGGTGFASEELAKKSGDTMEKKLGVRHPMKLDIFKKLIGFLNSKEQNPERCEKISKSLTGRESSLKGTKWEDYMTPDQLVVRKEQNRIGGIKGYKLSRRISKPQIQLYKMILSIWETASLDYEKLNRMLDIGIGELKLDIEYDTDWTHDGMEKSDKERTEILESSGWKTVRFRNNLPTMEELEKIIEERMNEVYKQNDNQLYNENSIEIDIIELSKKEDIDKCYKKYSEELNGRKSKYEYSKYLSTFRKIMFNTYNKTGYDDLFKCWLVFEPDVEEAKRIELSLLTSELSEEFSKILEIDIDDMQKKIYEF